MYRELEHVLLGGQFGILILLERIFRHSAAEQEPGAVENLAEKTAKTGGRKL